MLPLPTPLPPELGLWAARAGGRRLPPGLDGPEDERPWAPGALCAAPGLFPGSRDWLVGHVTLMCGSAAQGHTGLGPVSPEPHIQALWAGFPAPGLWPCHPSAFLPAVRAALQVRAPVKGFALRAAQTLVKPHTRHHGNHAETGAQTWKTNRRVKHQDSECRAGTLAQDHNPNATLLTARPRGPDGRSRDVRQPCPSSSPFLLWAQGDEGPVPLGLLTALGREGPRLPSLLHTPLSPTPAQWAVVSELRPTDTHSLVGTLPSLS